MNIFDIYPTEAAVERFWSKVNKTDGCWLWTGTKDKDGYGIIFFCRKQGKAHRLSYVIHYDAIPIDHWVLHHCDNPCCVNPEHLYAGTLEDNVRDAMERHRLPTGDRNGSRLHPEKRPRGDDHWTHKVDVMPTIGEDNYRAKITADEVRVMRSIYAQGVYSQSQLGRMFGLTQTSIGRIVNRRGWNHVE